MSKSIRSERSDSTCGYGDSVSDFTHPDLTALRPREGRWTLERGGWNSTWGPAVFAALLVALFIAIFRWQISPNFGYGGIRYRDPDWWYVAFGLMMVWAQVHVLGRKIRDAGDLVLGLVVYMVGIPAAIIPQIIDIESTDRSFVLSVVYFFVTIGVIQTYRGLRRIRPASRSLGSLNRRYGPIGLALVMFTVITLLLLHQAVGLSVTPASFADVYELRAEYSAEFAGSSSILGYIVALQIKAVSPALIAIGLSRSDRIPLALVGMVAQYILFATTVQKQALFSIIAVVGLSVLLRSVRSFDFRALGIAILGLCLASSLLDVASRRTYWTEIIVDRFFFWPGFLPVQYYETFKDRQDGLWSDAFLSTWIRDRTGAGWTPETLAGFDLTGSATVNANASFLADGFANMAYAGILLEAAVLVLALLLLSRAAKDVPQAIALPICVMPAVSLANGSPITAFLSGGVLGVLVIFVWLGKSPTSDRGAHG